MREYELPPRNDAIGSPYPEPCYPVRRVSRDWYTGAYEPVGEDDDRENESTD